MKRYVLLVTSMALCFALHESALAETQQLGFYASVKAGAGVAQADDLDLEVMDTSNTVDVDDESDVVPVVGLALGWDFYKSSELPVRVELEYTHMNDADFSWQGDVTVLGFTTNERFEAEVSADVLMLNGYYDFRNRSRFTPFVQAGLGLAILKTDVKRITDGFDAGTEKDTNVNFTADIGAGVGFALTEQLTLDASYRFAYLGPAGVDVEIAFYKVEADVWRHDMLLGLRYAF
ncbi:outer membrane protein [Desulfocurvibacter africanus]|uniref:outer membrane protein n=1 Tax=Desulfocurvibacter africanus TaxID=873 RepID=UPI0003F927D8|nr:outer membrane beta-barrel protein [Desulfocurvibacter africanus]